MTVDGHTLRFTYDAEGSPVSLTYDGITYYYVTNLQGDVIAILNGSRNQVASYIYDAWGNVLNAASIPSNSLASINPLRYRGYVYDKETKLYYLQSRYYNPLWGRFISADSFISTGQGVLSYNMFAYCLNNPVNCSDKTGKASDSYAGWGGGVIGEWLYELITGETHPNKQARELETQIVEKQNKMIANAGKSIWDAYMRGYNFQQEAQLHNGQSLLDGFNHFISKPEEAVDLIGAEVGMSMAVYNMSTIIVTSNPTIATVVGATWGVVWAGRSLYRAAKGIILDS